MSELSVGLIILAISGLAFTAYNHHEFYKKNVGRWMRTLYMAIAFIYSWNISSWTTEAAMVDFVTPDKVHAAKNAARVLTIDNFYPASIAFIALFAWLAFMVSENINKDMGKGGD